MNTENLSKFMAALASDPALRDKLKSVEGHPAPEVAERMAALSEEAGIPVSADDFLAVSRGELSPEDLEKVAGGVGVYDPAFDGGDSKPFDWHTGIGDFVKGFFDGPKGR